MKTRGRRLSWLSTVVMIMGISGLARGAMVDYSENFEWGQTAIPLSAGTGGSGYWYADVSGFTAGVRWGIAPYGNLVYQGSFSFDGNMFRDFRMDGTLGTSEFFSKATVQYYSRHNNGGDSNSSLVTRVWLLDPSRNGYMGSINRPGEMTLYRVVGGVLTQIVQKPESEVPDGNAKVVSLSVINGSVVLSFYYDGAPGTVYTLTAADSAYSQFTTIGIGGAYGWGETMGFDNVTLTQSINYSQNFEWGGDTQIPVTTGTSASDYWYSDAAGLWAAAWGSSPYGKWLYSTAGPAFDGNVYRNFRTVGTLGADESFTQATVQYFARHCNGTDGDAALQTRVWILDSSRNGYMGLINRPGEMTLYRVVAGVLTQIAQKPESEVPDGNGKVISLSVVDGSVVLSFYYDGTPETVYSLTAADTPYSKFTTIGLGGMYGWGETMGFDNVKLTSKLAGVEAAAAKVVKTSITPVIDGLADSIWSSANEYTLDYIGSGSENYSGPNDATVSFRVLWDDTAIYYLIAVRDDAKSIGLPFTGNWNIDGLEIYTDANYSRGTSYAADDFQTAINWGSTIPYIGAVPGMSAATVEIDGGYRLEVALPWSGLGLGSAPGIDQLFGMGVGYNDRDSGDTRQTQLMFATKGVLLWSRPCDFVIGKLAAARVGGDANCDGKVDVSDLGILAANYGGTNKTWALGDFSGDGKVDVSDLGILAAHYGTGAGGGDFAADYARIFGTPAGSDDTVKAVDEKGTSLCGGLGLPLIAGLMLAGLMMLGSSKLEE